MYFNRSFLAQQNIYTLLNGQLRPFTTQQAAIVPALCKHWVYPSFVVATTMLMQIPVFGILLVDFTEELTAIILWSSKMSPDKHFEK